MQSKTGNQIKCQCPYCKEKSPDEIVIDATSKKHFLFRRNQEIKELNALGVSDRLDYMSNRIDNAIDYYNKLRPVFKSEESNFLKIWKRVIPDLRDQFSL